MQYMYQLPLLPSTPSKKSAKKAESKSKQEKGNAQEAARAEKAQAYMAMGKEDLVKEMKSLLSDGDVERIMEDVEVVRSHFYKTHKQEVFDKKEKFVASGEKEEHFEAPADPLEREFKELYAKYKQLRSEYNKKQEEKKEANYKKKLEIITSIRELVNTQESLNKTFNEFRELQGQWRELGAVPQQYVNDLWRSYNLHVGKFYDYVQVNKELRDLDLKKNLEAKIELCEKAEELLAEKDVQKAFRRLQKLHETWRETGPEPREKREEMWERFSEATKTINKAYQDYHKEKREEQKEGLAKKQELAEQAKELAEKKADSHKEWNKLTKEAKELMESWKKAGHTPGKKGQDLYLEFRNANNNFYKNRREFFKGQKEVEESNLQLKTELCIQAEKLSDSDDWKNATGEIIALQKKWKEIGPVPRPESQKIWKRFRGSCNAFFERKEAHFKSLDKEKYENVEKRQAVIDELKKLNVGTETEKEIEQLKDMQKRWHECGPVPRGKQGKLNDEYRKLINERFGQLDIKEDKAEELKFSSKLKQLGGEEGKIRDEKRFLQNKKKKIESELTTLENNLTFFTESKNSSGLLDDMKQKVEDMRKETERIDKQLVMLDKAEKGKQ